jgi:hypothetical protein
MVGTEMDAWPVKSAFTATGIQGNSNITTDRNTLCYCHNSRNWILIEKNICLMISFGLFFEFIFIKMSNIQVIRQNTDSYYKKS